MRFYFDIHYCGKVHADNEGEEFDTIEDARAYVLSTTKEFHRLDQRLNRKVILYARIEITDRQGTSLTVPISAGSGTLHHLSRRSDCHRDAHPERPGPEVKSMSMTEVGPIGTSPSQARTSFVEWGPVLAGAVLAAALSFVLLTFGTAIGLSATSPWPGSGISAKVLASLAVFWVMAQQIGAFMVGGYVAGRMRARWHEPNQDEVEFRDGLHGGLVWAVGIVIGAAMLMATAGAVARTGAEVAGKAAASVASTANPMDLTLDTLLRPMAVAQAGTPAQGGAAGATTPAIVGRADVDRSSPVARGSGHITSKPSPL